MFESRSSFPIYEISHKYVETPDASSYSRHMHNCCELLLFVSGDANYNIDGILYKPNPYDLLIIPRATYHYFIPVSPLPYENYVLDFDPCITAVRHAEKIFARPVIINIKDDKEFCRFFKRLDLYRESYSKEDFSICAGALLRELLVYCSYRMDQSVLLEPERPPLVDTVLRLIEENLERSIDAEFVAAELRLSKSYIQNMFSQSMHIGLKQYIMQKKVFAAHSDMMNGMSASDASAKYAFTDYSVFFRLYKKILGYPPRQTRQRNS